MSRALETLIWWVCTRVLPGCEVIYDA